MSGGVCTLSLMTKDSKPQAAPASDPAWNDNPVVVVSRQRRVLRFPARVLLEEVSVEEQARLAKADAAEVNEQTVSLEMGVTFLGAFTTIWSLVEVAEARDLPHGAPRLSDCQVVKPISTAEAMLKGRAFQDGTERRSLDPAKVQAGFLRVMEYCRRHGCPHLWETEAGFDDPVLTTMPLRSILRSEGEGASFALGATMRGVNYAKRADNLGALHDYAVRSGRTSWALVDLCRKRRLFFR